MADSVAVANLAERGKYEFESGMADASYGEAGGVAI